MEPCDNCGEESERELCEICNDDLLKEEEYDRKERDKWQG